MNLSMEIIADKLLAYISEKNILDGKMEIRGARLLSTVDERRHDILYIAPARDFFDDDEFDNCVLCVNGIDWIRLVSIDINKAFTAVLDIFEEFNAWENMLREAVERGLDIQHFIDISRYALPFPIFITDAFGNIIGYSREYGVGDVDVFWDSIVLHGKIHDRVFSRSLTDDHDRVIHDWDVTPRIYNTHPRRSIGLYILQNGEIIGSIIIIEQDRSLSAGTCQLADIFRDAVSSALNKRGQNAELRPISAIMQDYLNGEEVDRERLWIHVLGCVGRQNEDFELILLKNTRRADFNYKSNMSYRMANAGVECFCMPYDDYVLAVIACGNEAALMIKARELLYGDEYLYGVSLSFSSVETMRVALSQAMLAIKIGNKISGTVNRCADYAYAYLLSRLAEDNGLAAGLLHPALTTLKKYDETRRTSLYSTLYEYLRLDRNVAAAAKHLFIHRNTMIYRLQRLEDLLNLNLDDINVRMYLMLSYHIDMIRQHIATGVSTQDAPKACGVFPAMRDI